VKEPWGENFKGIFYWVDKFPYVEKNCGNLNLSRNHERDKFLEGDYNRLSSQTLHGAKQGLESRSAAERL
jgi:hypothetical protein